MNIGNFNTGDQVFIIAEVGNNHEGSFSLAEEMIGLAAESGANAVKFQTIIPDRLVSATQTARIEQLSKFRFTYEQFASLKKTADAEGIMFLSTPFDLESAKFLDTIVPAFKIASGDNTFYPLIETIAQTGKPIIMSAGITEYADIEKSVNIIRKNWDKTGVAHNQLAILHCVVSYPTPPEQANILAISELKKLGVTVGYSDHTIGIDAAVLSVALGARIIEKHFTIDNNYSAFRDHQLSADPRSMKEFVEKVRLAEILLGKPEKSVLEAEKANAVAVRRSIVAARDLAEGEIISVDDITWVRPGGGIAPGEEAQVIGQMVRSSIKNGQMLMNESFSK